MEKDGVDLVLSFAKDSRVGKKRERIILCIRQLFGSLKKSYYGAFRVTNFGSLNFGNIGTIAIDCLSLNCRCSNIGNIGTIAIVPKFRGQCHDYIVLKAPIKIQSFLCLVLISRSEPRKRAQL